MFLLLMVMFHRYSNIVVYQRVTKHGSNISKAPAILKQKDHIDGAGSAKTPHQGAMFDWHIVTPAYDCEKKMHFKLHGFQFILYLKHSFPIYLGFKRIPDNQ